MDAAALVAFARYNRYANRLVLEVAARMSAEQLAFESQHSYSSVEKMLRHMLGTERFFLAQCRGEEMPRQQFSTLASLDAAFYRVDDEIVDYLSELPAQDLCRVVVVDFGKTAVRLTVWQVFLQVFAHATHHRGELSILMTELGFPLPTMDIIVQLVRESGQEWPYS